MRNTILIVDDEEKFRRALSEYLKDKGYNMFIADSGKQCMTILDDEDVDLVLLDVRLKAEDGVGILKGIRARYPDKQVIMMTAFTTFESAVESGRYGCFRYVKKPFEMEYILGNIEDALKIVKLARESEWQREEDKKRCEIIGASRQMLEIREKLKRIAPSLANVLITGETGVGKELIAREIHNLAGTGTFVAVNCCAVPEALLESELFGYEKGAFTDARKSKVGLVELASPGTLFLDEIGEMSLGLQAKLLRVIENKSFRRVGGTEEVTVHPRVVAATNKDLKDLVAKGAFREDLYYRLIVIPVYVPPLRERAGDVRILVRHFVDFFNRELGKHVEVSEEAMNVFTGYHWPGNIRELRNMIERIILLESDERILEEHLPLEMRHPSAPPAGITADGTAPVPAYSSFSLKETGLIAIKNALLKTGGNKTKAAMLLGISRQTLRARLKDCEVPESSDRPETIQTR